MTQLNIQLKIIEYNNDGTINITDDTGTKFTNCYPTSKDHSVCSSDDVITVTCYLKYDVAIAERLQEWLKELDQHTTHQGMLS